MNGHCPPLEPFRLDAGDGHRMHIEVCGEPGSSDALVRATDSLPKVLA